MRSKGPADQRDPQVRRRLSEPRNWVLVVELDDVVPRRDLAKPNLYVGLTIEAPAIRYERLKIGYGPAWLQGHLVRLRDDLVSGPILSQDEARRELRMAIRCLKSEGYAVNRDSRVWTVYVIELDPKGSKDPGKGFVYVGETSKTPEERFKEHIKGKRNRRGRLYSQAVRKFGRSLRMDLAPDIKYFDAASSRAAEKRWARKMRAEGYRVVGGH
jgi:GIY-YIG catalytic domain